MEINKEGFKDEKGRYIVQGLFLEDRYNTDLAYYTLAGEDKEYKGKLFPSLKRLYLETADPIEYTFATTYLYDWDHWQRMCRNAIVSRHIESWREELELSLRSEAISALVDMAINKDHYQAAKFLQDKGWDVSKRGRPSKEDIQQELIKEASKEKEYSDGVALLKNYRGKDG